jgi:hypothetical protein
MPKMSTSGLGHLRRLPVDRRPRPTREPARRDTRLLQVDQPTRREGITFEGMAEPLNPLESAVLDLLLSRTDEGYAALRDQLTTVEVTSRQMRVPRAPVRRRRFARAPQAVGDGGQAHRPRRARAAAAARGQPVAPLRQIADRHPRRAARPGENGPLSARCGRATWTPDRPPGYPADAVRAPTRTDEPFRWSSAPSPYETTSLDISVEDRGGARCCSAKPLACPRSGLEPRALRAAVMLGPEMTRLISGCTSRGKPGEASPWCTRRGSSGLWPGRRCRA